MLTRIIAQAAQSTGSPDQAGAADLIARFGAERAKVLRRRLMVFCCVGTALVLISVGSTLSDWRSLPDPTPATDLRRLAWEGCYDLLLLLLFAFSLLITALRLPTRRGIVGHVQRLTAAACVVAFFFEGITAHMDARVLSGALPRETAVMNAAIMALGATTALFSLAMALIPMRWRESFPIAAVILLGALAALALSIRAPLPQAAAVLALLAAALTAGIAWSQWRFSAMDAQFQADEMRERLEQITGELAYARRVHEALFPPPLQRGSIRVRYKYEPMREIGGDFLFVQPESFEGKGLVPITVVVIDVSGHGVPAALTVSRLHGELQRFYGVHPYATPGQLIENLNTFAYHAMAPQGMFATAIAIQVDVVMREVRYANAGHPPAVLRLADGAIRDLASTATMLGVLERADFEPGEVNIPAPAGASVLAYTDGAFEATNAQGEPFSLERVRAIGSTPVGDRSRALVDAVIAFRRGVAQDDLLAVELAWGEGETIMHRPATGMTRITRILTGGGTRATGTRSSPPTGTATAPPPKPSN